MLSSEWREEENHKEWDDVWLLWVWLYFQFQDSAHPFRFLIWIFHCLISKVYRCIVLHDINTSINSLIRVASYQLLHCTCHVHDQSPWYHSTYLQLYCPSHLLENISVMVIVWRLRWNIIRTALRWIVWHNVHSQQHTDMSSSYRSNRLGLSHWDSYAVHRGGCLELYYCNMVEWFCWDSSLISTTNWFPSVLWHFGFGHLACKNHPQNDI